MIQILLIVYSLVSLQGWCHPADSQKPSKRSICSFNLCLYLGPDVEMPETLDPPRIFNAFFVSRLITLLRKVKSIGGKTLQKGKQ